ncbi:MAG: hypothetical protein COA57_02485 [Flavobacteriales bacterium]|nr:MAG: hypothetical protein COA57_02485 [Flavobacteriales bacterium]
MFKQIIILIVTISTLMFFNSTANAQCTSAGDGNWDVNATWGGDCGGTRTPNAADDVEILAGHDIIIPTGVSAACSKLSMMPDGGITPTTLILNGTSSLTVTDELEMHPLDADPGSDIESKITMNGNNITCNSLYMESMKDKKKHAQTIDVGTGTLTVSNNIDLNDNDKAKITIDLSSGGTLVVGGDILFNDKDSDINTASGTTGSVNYNKSGAQTVVRSITNDKDIDYFNLTLSGSGVKTANDHITVNGNFSIQGTTSFDIAAGKKVTYGGSATTEYNGSAAQTTGDEIDESNTDNTTTNITINNTSDVTLGSNAIVTGTLTFTNGNLNLGTYNLTIGSSGSISGYNSSRYVVTDGTGYLRQNNLGSTGRSGNIDFPIGISTTSYTLATINNDNSDDDDDFSARVCDKVRDNGTCSGGTPASNNAVDRNWDINMQVTNSSTISTDVTLNWNTASDELTGFTNGSCYISKHDGSDWTKQQGAGDGSSGSRTATGVSGFGGGGFGMGSGGALPIELLSFTATLTEEKTVKLMWSTAAEINNDYFTIERSTNGLTFEEIAEEPGAGNSNERRDYETYDDSPVQGTVYYRLKQTDYDGKYEYFKLISVSYEVTPTGTCILKVYPNPCYGQCNVSLSECQGDENSQIQIDVVDVIGNKVTSYIPTRNMDGSFNYYFDKGNYLVPGVYIVRAASVREEYSKRVILK